jgi:hypothetical protein
MSTWSDIQAVELFHLLFLEQLGRKVDRRHCILKGGCNLRFFLKSIRYSEDMDLDVHGLPPGKLAAVVEGILQSAALSHLLAVRGMSIQRWTAPKQTDTTQRWKFLLALKDRGMELNTKVEFSRRGMSGDPVFEGVDPLLVREYSLGVTMASHYALEDALAQKVGALAHRREPQARDIFDLHHLLLSGAGSATLPADSRQDVQVAVDRAMTVPFDAFRSHVLSYLHPDWQDRYDSASTWQDIVLHVADALTCEPRCGMQQEAIEPPSLLP